MVVRSCFRSILNLQGSGKHIRYISYKFFCSSNPSQILQFPKNALSNRTIFYPKPLWSKNCLNCLAITFNMDYSCNGSNRGRISKPKEMFKGALNKRQENFRKTEEQLKNKGKVLLNDFKVRKTRMKAKVEEFIERENIWTIPNFLCIFRISLSPWLGYLILEESYNCAVFVLACAGISDLLDGWIARNFKNQSSKLGSFLDPIADKILVATMFLTLTFVDIMPVYLTSLIIVRDVSLVSAGSYIRYKSLPPPRTLSKYFDLTLATAQLAPTLTSKINTTVQLITVGTTLAAPIFNYTDHVALQGLWCLTAVTTVASAVSYIYERNTYKFFNGKRRRKNGNSKE